MAIEKRTTKGGEVRYKLDLVVFSILNMFDGTSMGVPALDIVARPHPDDRPDHKAEGENWWHNGRLVNDDGEVLLHEAWCNGGKPP